LNVRFMFQDNYTIPLTGRKLKKGSGMYTQGRNKTVVLQIPLTAHNTMQNPYLFKQFSALEMFRNRLSKSFYFFAVLYKINLTVLQCVFYVSVNVSNVVAIIGDELLNYFLSFCHLIFGINWNLFFIVLILKLDSLIYSIFVCKTFGVDN
jgi:hypothetical protein